jgi:hypothetical protein
MWIFTNNAYLSGVSAISRPNELLVRARHDRDTQRIFPWARASVTPPPADYRYRAFVPRSDVTKAIAAQITEIDYTNFKASVRDLERHNVNLRAWRRWRPGRSRRERGPRSAGVSAWPVSCPLISWQFCSAIAPQITTAEGTRSLTKA